MLISPKDRDIYVQGEANIFQEQLEDFLALAEEFELSGLTENSDGVGKENPRAQFDNLYDRDLGEDKRRNEVAKIKSEDTKKRGLIPTTKENVNQASFMSTGTIDTMKDSTERRPDGYHACTKCDYTSRKKDHAREHVEKHIEGLEYPCSDCNKVFRSSHSFRSHRRSHKAQAIVKNE